MVSHRSVDYRDNQGIMRRVLLPDGADSDPTEGIPVSLPVDDLFDHMPLPFRQKLMEELWARDLIEPNDFLRPGALEQIRSAWLSVAKKDSLDIQNLARERTNHG